LGWVALGLDGVFRSYAGDGSVIDWRQLDPDQIAANVASGRTGPEIPTAEAYSDGRLVTDINQILQPMQSQTPSKRQEARAVLHARECSLAEAPSAVLQRSPDDVPCTCIACGNDRYCYFSKLNEHCTYCRRYYGLHGQVLGGYCDI
jgi:hypothetical protein